MILDTCIKKYLSANLYAMKMGYLTRLFIAAKKKYIGLFFRGVARVLVVATVLSVSIYFIRTMSSKTSPYFVAVLLFVMVDIIVVYVSNHIEDFKDTIK